MARTGQPGHGPLEPGRFAAIRREWRSADRIELELPLTRGLESVDASHPDSVALRAGPLILMRILDENQAPPITRESLLAAQRDPKDAHAWQADTTAGPIGLKAFLDIDAEDYSAYHQVLSS